MRSRTSLGKSLELRGFDEYLEKIAKAGKDVDQAAANAVVAGGDALLEGMKERAPVYDNDPARPDVTPGLLRDTLTRSEPSQSGNFVSVYVGVPKDAPKQVAIYGLVQEYGTASVPSQPYVRPAIDEDKAKVRKAQRESLKKDGIL